MTATAYLVTAAIGGVICAVVAYRKERNPGVWFVVGALLPLIGIVILLAQPRPLVSPGGEAIAASAYDQRLDAELRDA
jgi:uncharacterized membrane protein HdeD (DUF308 family)